MNASRSSIVAVFAVLAFLLVGTISVRAQGEDTPSRKLGRGISNVLLGILEVPRSWEDVSSTHGEAAGLTWGTLRGIKRWGIRTGNGVYEILTFPDAEGPEIYPEFVIGLHEDETWRVKDEEDVY